MANRLDHVIDGHNLGGTAGGKQSAAEKQAGDLRKKVARDIEAIAGKAVALADERKAGLEKEAANAVKAAFEATAARATTAGAQMAKLASNLKYW